MPTPTARASRGEWKSWATPSTSIRPASGRYSPARTEQSVVFPAPFSPRRAWISPASRSRSTPSFAVVPKKDFVMPVSRTTTAESTPAGPMGASRIGLPPRSVNAALRSALRDGALDARGVPVAAGRPLRNRDGGAGRHLDLALIVGDRPRQHVERPVLDGLLLLVHQVDHALGHRGPEG